MTNESTGTEMTSLRWTSRDLEAFPDDGKRYEIVDGELYVAKQPDWHHQHLCTRLAGLLDAWCLQTNAGVANAAPGVIFPDDTNVAPDVVWISRERLAAALRADGHLHAAPDLVVEVLSPGGTNELRDREAKLKLLSTLYENDVLQSPLLPGFSCHVSLLFAGVV